MKVDALTEEDDFYIGIIDLWPDQDLLKKEIFDPSDIREETENAVLDLPGLHCPTNKNAHDFIKACLEAADDGADIMTSAAVRAIIEYRWRLTRHYIQWNQKYPYYVFIFVYFFYSTVLLSRDAIANA